MTKDTTMKLTVLAMAMLLALTFVVGVVTADKTISCCDDLVGAKIGVQGNTTGDMLVTKLENINGTKVERYSKGADAVSDLKAGKIDCVVIDFMTAYEFVKQNNDLKILNKTFSTEEYAFAVRKGNSRLVMDMNRVLAELKIRGIIDQIDKNFIPTSEAFGTCPYVSPANVDRSKGTLVVATNAAFPPYEYYDSNGKLTGIDIQIMQAVCDRLGYTLEFIDVPFDEVIPSVESKKADIGASALTITEERKENITFTTPYSISQQVIIVKENNTAKSPAPIFGLIAGLFIVAFIARRR